MSEDPHFNQYLDPIRELDFVRGLRFSAESKRLPDRGVDGELRIQTPKGTFTFDVEEKNSYLDRSLLHALIAQAKHHIDATHRPMLLLHAMSPPLPLSS